MIFYLFLAHSRQEKARLPISKNGALPSPPKLEGTGKAHTYERLRPGGRQGHLYAGKNHLASASAQASRRSM